MMTTSVSFMFASRRIDYALLRSPSRIPSRFLAPDVAICSIRRLWRTPAGCAIPRQASAGGFMTVAAPSLTDQAPDSRNRLILAVYTLAIFVVALLLFSVQPLFTKMVLPRLGGSPAVWSVAMVFFQSLLLGGHAP